MGWLSDVFSKFDDGFLNPIASNVVPAIEDTGRNELAFMDDLGRQDYEGMHNDEANFEDIGEKAFGTGGWYAAVGNYFFPGAGTLAAKLINNEGDSKDAWRNYGKNYAKSYAAQSALDYANAGTSDYSLANQEYGTPSFGEGYSTADLSVPSDYTSSSDYSFDGQRFGNNAPIKQGNAFQKGWDTFKATDPIKASASQGAATAGIKALFSGDNIGKAALEGAVNGGISGYKNSSTGQNSMNYISPEFGSNDQSYALPWQLGGQDYSNAYGQAPTYSLPQEGQQDWYSQLQQSPWFQGIAGAAAKSQNPFLAKAGAALTDKESRDSSPWYTVGQGLAQLYNNKQQQKLLQGQLNMMDQNRGAYMSQLASDLARKDAAAGRNSQYGPRSVELQAKMAALDAQRMPTMEKLANGIGTLRGQNANTVLEGLWKNRQLAPQAYQSLKSLFGGSEEDNAQ